MNFNNRKRKTANVVDDSDDSLELVKIVDKKPLHTPHFTQTSNIPVGVDKKPKLELKESLGQIPEFKPLKPVDGLLKRFTGRDGAINEIRSIAESSNEAVAALRTQNEEWKEAVAVRCESLVGAHNNRLEAVERSAQRMKEKTYDTISECRMEIQESERRCRADMDTRLRDFGHHLAAFFLQNHTKNDNRVMSQPITPSMTDFGMSKTAVAPSTRETEPGNFPPLRRTITSDGSHLQPSSSTVVTTANTVDTDADPFSELNIPPTAYVTQRRLTRRGYQAMLRNLDFSNFAMLEALSNADSKSSLRDYNLFCDISPHTVSIDYVMRIGGTAYSIMNKAPKVVYEHHPLLRDKDLSRLRIFELSMSDEHLNREQTIQFEEWKEKHQPPKYVYELGALFIRRKFKGKDKEDLIATCYNVVMDAVKPEKPIWAIVRPGWGILAPKPARRGHKDSQVVFEELYGAMMACFAKDIEDFSFSWGPDASASYPQCLAAQDTVKETACKLPVELKAKAADLEEMERFITSARQQAPNNY
ncbi:hypothetical protein SCUP515_10845 [Seiridium cupressi]